MQAHIILPVCSNGNYLFMNVKDLKLYKKKITNTVTVYMCTKKCLDCAVLYYYDMYLADNELIRL